jgi:hypothetical protein
MTRVPSIELSACANNAPAPTLGTLVNTRQQRHTTEPQTLSQRKKHAQQCVGVRAAQAALCALVVCLAEQ